MWCALSDSVSFLFRLMFCTLAWRVKLNDARFSGTWNSAGAQQVGDRDGQEEAGRALDPPGTEVQREEHERRSDAHDDEPLREALSILPVNSRNVRLLVHPEDADLIRQAVLLAVGISQAQAFLDGNKRIAFAACDVFLRLNSRIIQADPVELARQLEQVASHSGDLSVATDRFERWLRPLISAA